MRWINRDPIGEDDGGINLYEFCFNSSMAYYDMDGGIPSLNWGGYTVPGNGRFKDATDDFMNGGGPNTYHYVYPDSATKRLMAHPAIKAVWDRFENMRCGTSRTESGTISYTAGVGQFFYDALTFFGSYDLSGRPNRVNSMENDIGYEALGSFTGSYTLSIDCQKCFKSLYVEVENDITMASATRIPGTSLSLITYPLLKPIKTVFTYLVVERVRK